MCVHVWQITILLVVDLCSLLAYFMMTHPLPIAGKMPIKTLVAKQLPTNMYTHYVYDCEYSVVMGDILEAIYLLR